MTQEQPDGGVAETVGTLCMGGGTGWGEGVERPCPLWASPRASVCASVQKLSASCAPVSFVLFVFTGGFLT